jgi:hypothetical protein
MLLQNNINMIKVSDTAKRKLSTMQDDGLMPRHYVRVGVKAAALVCL